MPLSYEPYFGIIQRALDARGSKPDDWQQDKALGVNVYIARMCDALAQACRDRGATDVTMLDVVRQDAMASGHTDYHRKLALYCFELERKGLATRPSTAPMQPRSAHQ